MKIKILQILGSSKLGKRYLYYYSYNGKNIGTSGLGRIAESETNENL